MGGLFININACKNIILKNFVLQNSVYGQTLKMYKMKPYKNINTVVYNFISLSYSTVSLPNSQNEIINLKFTFILFSTEIHIVL